MTTVHRLTRPVRLLAVALALVAGAAAGVTAPTAADAAESCDGVWVVVDATRLGGSVQTRCAPGTPSSGLDALQRAGFAYEFVPRIPGQVCTIDGQPDPCNGAPADAYWSYWHADAGGSWTYSQRGAGNRTPAKGTVEGWSFGSGEQPGRTPPANAPAEPEPSPEPEPKPTPEPAPEPEPSPTATAAPAPEPTEADDPDGRDPPTDGSTAAGADPDPAPTAPGAGQPDPAAEEADPVVDADDERERGAADDGPDDPVSAPSDDEVLDDEAPDEVPDDEVALGDVAGDGGGGAPVGVIAGGVLVTGLAGAGVLRARRRDDLGEG